MSTTEEQFRRLQAEGHRLSSRPIYVQLAEAVEDGRIPEEQLRGLAQLAEKDPARVLKLLDESRPGSHRNHARVRIGDGVYGVDAERAAMAAAVEARLAAQGKTLKDVTAEEYLALSDAPTPEYLARRATSGHAAEPTVRADLAAQADAILLRQGLDPSRVTADQYVLAAEQAQRELAEKG